MPIEHHRKLPIILLHLQIADANNKPALTQTFFGPYLLSGGPFVCGFEYQLARALKERQCTLEGQARYVNVRGSVHWKGVYRVGDRDLGVQKSSR